MKYLNRQRLGIEAFLASRSSVFSRHNELDPDELIARLREQPYAVRSRVAQDVKIAITELTSGKYDIGSLIPAHIKTLSDGIGSAERVGKLRPFFAWLQSLWRDNDQARSEWISQLKTVAGRLNTVSGECLMAVSTGYNNQRALLRRMDDGAFELSLHERRWGRLSIVFPECETEEEQWLSMLGFVYIIEGEALENGRFRFDILFDTEFSYDNDVIRALKTTAWKQVSFTCAEPRTRLEAVDYTFSADIRGASRLETVRYSSEVLCEKVSLTGEAMLSAGERMALNTARLIAASKVLAEKGKEGDARSEDTLIDLADNRYAFERVTEMFDKENAETISKLLKKSLDFMENDDIDKALGTLKRLPGLMNDCAAEGGLVPLMCRVHEMMCRAGECDESENTREAVFRKAAAAFCAAVEPQLIKLGFTGCYPHYRRIRRGRAEYISAVVDREPEALSGNRLSYAFMLCASRVKMKRAERKAGILRGISFEETRGTDFFNERPEYSDSGIIDCAANPPHVEVWVDVVTGKTSEPDSAAIEAMLKCAKRAMNGFSLKRSERRLRRQRTDKRARRRVFFSSFLSAFARFMPSSNIMCAVVAALYLWGRTQSEFIASVSVRTAVFPIALAGVVTALLRALLYCLVRRKKLWIY